VRTLGHAGFDREQAGMGILDWATYEEARREFSWRAVWDVFDGSRDEFNIAHECIDRHVDKGTGLRIKFADGETREYGFEELAKLSNRFANALAREGIGKGDRVAIMLDPSLEYYVALFGVLKRGAIAVPFYPQFGPEAVDFRLRDSSPKILVTTEDKRELAGHMPSSRIVIVGGGFDRFLGSETDSPETRVKTSGDDVAVFQYTSGTTRQFPEVIRHFHKSVAVLLPPAIFALGLRPGDRYFCPSHPSWGHGLWYGTFAPLSLGVPVGAYSGQFDEQRMLEALQGFSINNVSAAPTVYRRLKNSGLVPRYDLKMKKISYSMEPMDTDTFLFLRDALGAAPCSFYGSTEVGVIIMNYNGLPDYEVKPGSLGKPNLGLEVAIIDDNGNIQPPGKIGEIAVRRRGQWIKVKDAGVCDDDGYYWHKGRSDEVIISSGWTISPTEVEDCLQKHPAVEEAVVVGAKDDERGLIVKAYVKPRGQPSDSLKAEIQNFVRDRLSKHEYPRVIDFVSEIPKTTGGKIDRKLVKSWTQVTS
jgi:acetyl-CoA synthetase